MRSFSDADVASYISANIGAFHQKRLESLDRLQLERLLRRKNPYLFKSKNIATVPDLVRLLLDAHLSSQEETLFGDFLEGLAIQVADKVHGGSKSSATGIDLEFVKDTARYIVSIKSGPNWGNSSQIKKMQQDFKKATAVIRQGNARINVVAVNGCCYGRDRKPDKGDYLKLCGQGFWELISGDKNFYIRIIKPLGHSAKRHNDAFAEQYSAVVNRFSREFSDRFCGATGRIDWPKLVAFSSAG